MRLQYAAEAFAGKFAAPATINTVTPTARMLISLAFGRKNRQRVRSRIGLTNDPGWILALWGDRVG